MDIAEMVSGIPGVVAMDGLDHAWYWSNPVGFHYALALSTDGAHAFEMNSREVPNLPLMAEALRFARQHDAALRAAAPFAVVEGFALPGTRFDVLASVIPAVHRYHEADLPRLNDVTFVVFPAYRCEFSGKETQREAVLRFDRMLDTVDLRRPPVPWVRMRFDNPHTGGGSVGRKRGITTEQTLRQEIKNLEGVDDGFIEFENFQGRVWRVTWDGALILHDGQSATPVPFAELCENVSDLLHHGAER